MFIFLKNSVRPGPQYDVYNCFTFSSPQNWAPWAKCSVITEKETHVIPKPIDININLKQNGKPQFEFKSLLPK